jgi:hypothetical protein
LGLLSTGISNWYRGLGWEDAGYACSARLNRGNIGLFPRLPDEVTVEAAEPGDDVGLLAEVLAVHDADRLGGVRSPALFATLLRARGQHQLLLARRAGALVAYLIIRGSSVVEWGGEADALRGLVRAWYERCDDPAASTSTRDEQWRAVLHDELSIATPRTGHPFADWLAHVGFTGGRYYHCMFYPIDPAALLAAYGLDDLTVAQVGEEFVLSDGATTVQLHRRHLAKLLFGPERVSDFGGDRFPLPFYQWSLEHV